MNTYKEAVEANQRARAAAAGSENHWPLIIALVLLVAVVALIRRAGKR